MSKKKLLALIINLVFVGIMFIPTALADIPPPQDCKPGEDPETTYCNPVKIPRNNQTPIVTPVIPTPDKPEPEIKPEIQPEVKPDVQPETKPEPPVGTNPIIMYAVAGTAVVVVGVSIGIFIKIRGKK